MELWRDKRVTLPPVSAINSGHRFNTSSSCYMEIYTGMSYDASRWFIAGQQWRCNTKLLLVASATDCATHTDWSSPFAAKRPFISPRQN